MAFIHWNHKLLTGLCSERTIIPGKQPADLEGLNERDIVSFEKDSPCMEYYEVGWAGTQKD